MLVDERFEPPTPAPICAFDSTEDAITHAFEQDSRRVYSVSVVTACHESHSLFEQVTPTTIFRSIRAFSLKLWDEASGKLVGFRQIRLARQREYARRVR